MLARSAYTHISAPAFSARLGKFELRVNRSARALCSHVNQCPRSQPASQPAARHETLETRVHRRARSLCLNVSRRPRLLNASWSRIDYM